MHDYDRLLDRCDAARFASASEADDLRESANVLLERLEKELGRA